MEKWRSKGKQATSKEESVLPPTKRQPGQNCSIMDKKKDRKWSFGGLLRRISSGQQNEVSSNDEDITYIPGHMLSKKHTKQTSKMKSKLGKMPRGESSVEKSEVAAKNKPQGESRDTSELIRSLRASIDQSPDSICPCNDSVNSRSSEGSLDALGRASRINRMKARVQAKRDHLCGNSSSDDDSHRSSQSSTRFRSEDSMQNVQRTDSCSRRTRGARTERYIKRMYRDDGNSSSDTRLFKPNDSASRTSNLTDPQYSSNSIDSSPWMTNDPTRISSQHGSSPSVARSLAFVGGEKNLLTPIEPHWEPRASEPSAIRCLRDMNENETLEREKLTWPKSNFRTCNPVNETYGSLRPRKDTKELSQQLRVLPPEPPPRSSKSRVFGNVYGTQFPFKNVIPTIQQSPRCYYGQSANVRNPRSYNSDNETLLSDYVAPTRLRHYWQNSERTEDSREIQAPQYRNDNFNSIERSHRDATTSPANTINREYRQEQENYNPRIYFEDSVAPSKNCPRSTSSLPKGVQLFSRQRLANCHDEESDVHVPGSPEFVETKPMIDRTFPRSKNSRETASCQSSSSSTRVFGSEVERKSNWTYLDNEAERKRSSKNLEDALSELEAIYNSLRLSDEDLLERAEQRSMEEYREKAAKSAAEHSLKSCSDTSSNEKEELFRDSGKFGLKRRETDLRMEDDMAYRRMNPKDRPSSVNGQSSLPQISYLATSPNLSIRDTDLEHIPRSRRGTPDLTRDDLLFRSISHANNALRVIEPQPPFGIPLGPVTGTTESDYLHAKPTKYEKTRSLFIPKSEPDVVSDDLAFRNLRKDTTKDACIGTNKNTNLFLQVDSLIEPRLSPKNTFTFGTRKKRAVRSHSADLYGIPNKLDSEQQQNHLYDDYVKSTKKVTIIPEYIDPASSSVNRENLNRWNFANNETRALNIDETSDHCRLAYSSDLDINGNRPKSALQQKIQVYVPQESRSCNDEKRLFDIDTKYSRDSTKLMITESEDSSPELCDSRQSSTCEISPANDKTIEQFTEQEISEYKQLCQDLEKLIQRTADDEMKRVDRELRDDNEAAKNSEDNSQSEFDEWEKLLNEDYELPASISGFDETVEITSTERDDDLSSSRSAGLSVDSENVRSLSTKTVDKFANDDFSSTSELDIGSNNDSFNDSVYDKFNQLLREVNDVPLVECTNQLSKYPTDELVMITNNLGGNDSNRVANENVKIDEQLSLTTTMIPVEQTQGANVLNDKLAHVLESRTKLVSPSPNLHIQDSTKKSEEYTLRNTDDEMNEETPRMADVETRPKCEIDEDNDTTVYREGENIEDEPACNDEEYAFKETSMHPFRKLCHLTNSITIYDIVLCSFCLTLLITLILTQ